MANLIEFPKSEGNKHCCYGTCNSDSRYRHRESMVGVFFMPFPKPITQREKCERWIKACGRPEQDFNVNTIKRHTYICSRHFVGGKGPTSMHPDPIPALLHSEEQVKRFGRKRKAPTPRGKTVKITKKDVSEAAEGLVGLSQELFPTCSTSHTVQEENVEVETEEMIERHVSTQTDVKTEEKEVQTIYEKEVLNAKIENMLLKNKIKFMEGDCKQISMQDTSTTLSLAAVKGDDAKMKMFTGLTFGEFSVLLSFLGDSVHNLTYWDGKSATKENVKKKKE